MQKCTHHWPVHGWPWASCNRLAQVTFCSLGQLNATDFHWIQTHHFSMCPICWSKVYKWRTCHKMEVPELPMLQFFPVVHIYILQNCMVVIIFTLYSLVIAWLVNLKKERWNAVLLKHILTKNPTFCFSMDIHVLLFILYIVFQPLYVFCFSEGEVFYI